MGNLLRKGVSIDIIPTTPQESQEKLSNGYVTTKENEEYLKAVDTGDIDTAKTIARNGGRYY
ncbi:MAG: hypothetical protein KBS41_05710 [Oscillospiraceae bacterium]|nr:hypothetical protein [Candidatus Equicaccousia limihippi]